MQSNIHRKAYKVRSVLRVSQETYHPGMKSNNLEGQSGIKITRRIQLLYDGPNQENDKSTYHYPIIRRTISQQSRVPL